ncbi:MAG: GTP-binding protein, partial [Oscillospiraceae bacterium]|nr:GTP-binding protein [Oscillospiraceae bacterium]
LQQIKKRFGCDYINLTKALDEGSRECSVVTYDDIERLADYDDEIAEAYIENKKVDVKNCIKENITKFTPVVFGAAQFNIGVELLLDAVAEYMPSAENKQSDSLSGIVYKVEHDKDIGKLAHVRMFGGTIKNRDSIGEEKITQIRRFNGSKYIDTGEVGAGDIAALCGLQNIKVGDIIGELKLDKSLSDKNYKLANPFLTIRVSPKTTAELTPLINAIKELTDEEPLINYKWEKSEREIHLNVTGEIQLEIISKLLKERYNLEADFSPPSVIYKETPAQSGEGYEAYTMPKPCWAVVRFRFDPLPRGSGVVYETAKIPHNKLNYKYQTHIESSFFQSLEQGMYGWEVTDFKCTLTDGEHHWIHTHPLDFFVATPMALMNGLSNTGTILLEPLLKYRINAAQEHLGKVISDVLAMRGEFDSPVITKGAFEMEAILPVATSLDYPIRLAALTGGKGTYYSFFHGYKDCPLELGATATRRGINPLDRAKWILNARGALQ